MRRLVATTAVLVSTLALSAACGEDEESPAGPAGPKTVEITFSGGTVTPNGKDVAVARGQDVELVIKADKPGELHVHTTEEQEVAFSAGTTTKLLELDEPPGVVEVESHDLGLVVVKLEIR